MKLQKELMKYKKRMNDFNAKEIMQKCSKIGTKLEVYYTINNTPPKWIECTVVNHNVKVNKLYVQLCFNNKLEWVDVGSLRIPKLTSEQKCIAQLQNKVKQLQQHIKSPQYPQQYSPQYPQQYPSQYYPQHPPHHPSHPSYLNTHYPSHLNTHYPSHLNTHCPPIFNKIWTELMVRKELTFHLNDIDLTTHKHCWKVIVQYLNIEYQ
eukprot:374701_1